MSTNGYFYMRSYYYKVKDQVFRALGYRCEICGHDDPEDLQVHHNDEDIYDGMPGLNRLLDARKKLNNGGGGEIELLCGECHEHRDLGKEKEAIKAIRLAEGWDDLEYNGFSGAIEQKDDLRRPSPGAKV